MNRAWLLIIALFGVLAIQLPVISRPPFDAHCFRQAQTLSTIDLFDLEGIDMTRPKTNYVGEPGVFVLEFPLFQAFCAWLYGWFGSHVQIVRLVNLLFTFANAGLTFALGRRLFGREAGMAAALIYLFAPLNLQYMTSTLIDPSVITFSLIAFLAAWHILQPKDTEGSPRLIVWLVFLVASVITALIKVLYLFPICVLMAATVLQRRKLSVRLVGTGLGLSVAGIAFWTWLAHARQVNDESYFTQQINATVLLGFKPLSTWAFYQEMARRLAVYLAGPLGMLLAVFAVQSAFSIRGPRQSSARFSLAVLACCVAGYLLAFPKVNLPHDYYSLMVSPYFCLLAGFGVGEMASRAARQSGWKVWFGNAGIVVLIVVAVSTGFFFRQPRLQPDPRLLDLQQRSQAVFEPWSFGMVFTAPDPRLPLPPNIGSEQPEALYATRLRGTGHLVADSPAALAIWQAKRPHYKNLKYVVFYGLTPPPEIVAACRETIVSDNANKWHAYRVK